MYRHARPEDRRRFADEREKAVLAENLGDLREIGIDLQLDPNTFEYLGWTVSGTRAAAAAKVEVRYDARSGGLRVPHLQIPPGGRCPPALGPGEIPIFKVTIQARESATPGRQAPVVWTPSGGNRFVPCGGTSPHPVLTDGSVFILGGAQPSPGVH